MKETKLLSMCEFIDHMIENFAIACDADNIAYSITIRRYKEFLQTPLELKHFIACGKPLKKPTKENYPIDETEPSNPWHQYDSAMFDYEEAFKDVLFEGFEILQRKGFEIIHNGNCCAVINREDSDWQLYHHEVKK